METIYQTAQIPMQIRAQLFGNQRQPILGAINDVIKEIRVRHVEIVTHESSDKLTG